MRGFLSGGSSGLSSGSDSELLGVSLPLAIAT